MKGERLEAGKRTSVRFFVRDNERQRGLFIKKDNINNFCAAPTLRLAEDVFLPTIKTMINNNKNNIDSTIETIRNNYDAY